MSLIDSDGFLIFTYHLYIILKVLYLYTIMYINIVYGNNQFCGITQQYEEVSGYSQNREGCYPKRS